MKPFLILFTVFLFTNSITAQEKVLTTEEVLNAAYAQAKKENKNVFVIFHASWCGWCHKMDTAMNDIRVKDFFTRNYVITHLVVHESDNKKHLENEGSLAFLSKYNGQDDGIPFWLIFDKNGKLLADSKIREEGVGLGGPGNNSGCPASKEEVEHFVKVLRKTSSLNENDLSIISKRFRENEQ